MGADPAFVERVWNLADRLLEGMHEGMLMGQVARQRDPVDWSGARSPLSAIFGGTNLPAFNTILQVLVVTAIEPQLAQQLARESPDLLLAYAGAEHEPTRIPALNFLRAMNH